MGSFFLVVVEGVDALEKGQAGGGQLFLALGEVIVELLADGDVVVVLVEVVDVFAVDATHYFKTFFAALDSFCRQLSPVAKVVAHAESQLVWDYLAGYHRHLLTQVDCHWLIV